MDVNATMDLGIIISIVGSAIAIVGVVIALFLWNRSEACADRRDLGSIILAIQEEMKDFHGRLEKQDAEFKAYLMNKK